MEFSLGVSPSLLAADYGYLADAACEAESAGAHSLHLDYMDGHYVPNISFGLDLIPALKRRVKIPLIAHLMISNTDERLKDFIHKKPHCIVLQEDAVENIGQKIEAVHKAGIKSGVAINPNRPLHPLYPLLPKLSLLVIMSVYPGFGGQTFIEDTLKKMSEAHNLRKTHHLSYDIAVDGGVNLETAKKVIQTGANILVAGTAVFGSGNVRKAIGELLALQG